MSLQLFFLWAKKLHRWLLLFVTVLGLWMMISGYLMHRDLKNEWTAGVDIEFVRYYHNTFSTWFLIVLGGQMLTGLLMWAIPEILKRKKRVQV